LLAAALPAAADPRSKLQEIQAKKEKAAAQAEKYAGKRDELLSTIEGLDARRAKVEAKVDDLDAELEGLDAEIDAAKERLTTAQQKVAFLTDELQGVLSDLGDRTDDFTQRAIEAYKGGTTAFLDSILGSTNFSDLLDRYAYWEATLDSDAQLVDEIQVLRDATEDRRELILDKQHEIATAKRLLEDDRHEIALIREKQAAVLAERQALVDEKENLLAQVNRKKAFWDAVEDQLTQDAQRIEDLLASGSTGAPHAGGQLLWPADGGLSSPYGYRTHPIFGDTRLHTGIDIGAAYGSDVWAADDGTVTYVGTMSGYGNVVIVDHGGGLATTYNHLSGFYVSSGTTVSRGSAVGAVGCTGYCTGPHLHFEVRINGSPVDPMPYLQ
jgi:murein DD-endopeptidase MepM/ murein hydrolase activator NlpD